MKLVLSQLEKDKPASFQIDGTLIQNNVKSIAALFQKEAEILSLAFEDKFSDWDESTQKQFLNELNNEIKQNSLA